MDCCRGSHIQWPKFHDIFMNQKKNPIMEAINWVCASAKDNHEWISEFSLILQDSKILGVLISTLVVQRQYGTPRPADLNNDLVKEGVILEMYSWVINMAMKTSFPFLFSQKKPQDFSGKLKKLMLAICMNGGFGGVNWR